MLEDIDCSLISWYFNINLQRVKSGIQMISNLSNWFQSTRNCLLLFLFLWVVSPYAVIEWGGEAQPGQVGHHQESGGATDRIPLHHGGSDSPSEHHDLNEGLDWMERMC